MKVNRPYWSPGEGITKPQIRPPRPSSVDEKLAKQRGTMNRFEDEKWRRLGVRPTVPLVDHPPDKP